MQNEAKIVKQNPSRNKSSLNVVIESKRKYKFHGATMYILTF